MLIGHTPHCDFKVLHRPGECRYCDSFPEWQELRELWGIAFTGHAEDTVEAYDRQGRKYRKTLIRCPSEQERPVEVIHQWRGNAPEPRETGEPA